jgi:hypothetical protein
MPDHQDVPVPQLGPPPERLVSTRRALHRLAEQVISPARAHATGRIGLRSTPGGFGTPVFADAVQLRVLGDQLIVQEQGGERSAAITTPAEMAAYVGRELLPEAATDTDPLEIDAQASSFLGDWYAFGATVLEELRAGAGAELDPSLVQLWPEHFDIAVELGSERDGRRAAYGASPGDELHLEPYLYVAPWGTVPEGDLWRATAFDGAELSYVALLEAQDRPATALSFFRERLDQLTHGV